MTKWPNRVQDILGALAALYPELTNRNDDDARREFTRRFAGQVAYELGPNWGTKRADPNRPLAAKVICTRDPFIGWEWDNPSGLSQFPDSIDLAGQVFVPVPAANYWLAVDPVKPPIVVPPTTDLVKAIGDILGILTEHANGNEDVLEAIDKLDITCGKIVTAFDSQYQAIISRCTTLEAEVRELRAGVLQRQTMFPKYRFTLPRFLGGSTVTLEPFTNA